MVILEYKLGNFKKLRDIGETQSLTCPECESKVVFHVFSNVDNELQGAFPFIKTSRVYFMICPACAARFAVDEDKGEAFAAGEKLAIGNFDFKKLKSFKEND